jgi:hypothetical protein
VLLLGASLTSALLWHWRHDLRSALPPTEPAPPPAEPAPPASATPAPAEAAPGRSSRTAPRRRVVRLGSSVNEVFAAFGTPDRIQPGKQSGDAVLHYGHLWLQITNGRVTDGDAAVFR